MRPHRYRAGPRLLGLAAGLFVLTASARGQPGDRTVEYITRALAGEDVLRQRAALTMIGEMYNIYFERDLTTPEIVPDRSDIFIDNTSVPPPPLSVTQALLDALEAFEKRLAARKKQADPETVALWLRAYGRLYRGVPRQNETQIDPEQRSVLSRQFPRLYHLPQDAGPRLSNYLRPDGQEQPPIVTRAAAAATLSLINHAGRVFGKPKLFTPIPAYAYLPLGLAVHPVTTLAGTGEFTEPFLDFSWSAAALLEPARLAVRSRDPLTRREGLLAIEQLSFTVRDQFIDPGMLRDPDRDFPPLEAQWKWYLLDPVLRGSRAATASGSRRTLGLGDVMSDVAASLGAPDVTTRLSAAVAARELTTTRRLALLTRDYFLGQNQPLLPVDRSDPLGEPTRALLPALTRAARDPSPQVRLLSVEAIENAELLAWPERGAVAASTQDRDVFVRWVAARTLGKIRPGDARVDDTRVPVDALARMMRDPDIDARMAALNALKVYGTTARRATDAVIFAMNRGDVDVRVVAVSTLEVIAEPARAAAALADVLRTGDVRVRRAAADALVRLGPAAKEALPALRDALTDFDADVRRKAGQAVLLVDR